MAGRPRFLSQPRGLTFQIEAETYGRLVEMLEAYRQQQPRAQMSDLMRHIISKAIEPDYWWFSRDTEEKDDYPVFPDR
jgi:hypothetical protein